MAIGSLSELEFVEVLQAHLSPSSPIRELRLLKGRAPQIEQIRKAFHSPGRHIFIYGDRGVGKSSLALAVGYYFSSQDTAPIQVACNRQSFFQVIRDIGNQMLNLGPANPERATRTNLGVQTMGISAQLEQTLQQRQVPELKTINEAISVIEYASRATLAEPVVIVDEFDQLATDEDRVAFADFIKQLGDRQVPAKFFFTGIGNALDQLLAAHHSCYRYLAAVKLAPLDMAGRFAIIEDVASSFDITVDRSSAYRIAACSDGFPHYIHLVCEKLFWRIFEDENVVTETQPKHYVGALEDAIMDIEPSLRDLYETATQKYKDDYQEVLWSVADDHEFKRRSSDIYQSYLEIMGQRARTPLTRDRFNDRMNSLKRPNHASILVGTRSGWYELREPILRGFIRLKAELAGVELAREHPGETNRRAHKRFSLAG